MNTGVQNMCSTQIVRSFIKPHSLGFLIFFPVSGDQVSACDEEGGGAPHPLHGGGEGGALCRARRDHGRLGKLRIRIRNSQLGRSGSGVTDLIIPFMEEEREAHFATFRETMFGVVRNSWLGRSGS
jgi:hypothetical protein